MIRILARNKKKLFNETSHLNYSVTKRKNNHIDFAKDMTMNTTVPDITNIVLIAGNIPRVQQNELINTVKYNSATNKNLYF